MRIKLLISFVLLVCVSVSVVIILAYQGVANEVRSFMFRGSMVRAQEIATSLEEYYQVNQTWQGAEALLSLSGANAGIMGHGRGAGGQGTMGNMMNQRLKLANAEGRILYDSSTAQVEGSLTAEELSNAIQLKNNGVTIGYLLPESAMVYSAADEQFLLSRLTRAALIAGLLGAGLSLLLAFFLAYQLMRPVRALTRAAKMVEKGDFSQRVPVHGNDELAQLSITFNNMADSLQKSQESRRAMTADIAHELRTPLAVQMAHLEALQDGIYPLTPENLVPILEQNQMLNHLVEDLRTLTLADGGQLKLDLVKTDIQSLVERVVVRFKPQAASRQVSLQMTTPNGCPSVMVDPARIEQILNNLLSNALRYTPDGGEIEIFLKADGKKLLVSVHDNGPGISEDALPYIFERFYRADRSRSRSEGGSGLGLAIALQIAALHGGTLTAGNDPQGGAVFTLSLPYKNS
jgi:two-component system, OmpR family, sensor histidine kinase BaeS